MVSCLSNEFAPAPANIRVMVIAEHEIVREGLRLILASSPGIEVIGKVKDLQEALAAAPCERPDIILLEMDLADHGGLDGIPDLLAAYSGTRIVVLTRDIDAQAHLRAVMRGVLGIVLKEKPTQVLIEAIRKVYNGEAWLDRLTMARILSEISCQKDPEPVDREAAKIANLTDREREVVVLVRQGLRSKQVAAKLRISETTVRHHLTSIYSKLGVAGRYDLITYTCDGDGSFLR